MMFTTTDVNSTSATAAGTSAGVCPSYTLLTNSTNHGHLTTTNSPWRLTSPSMVSISSTENLLLLQSSSTVRHLSPANLSKSSICIDTPLLGQLESSIIKREEEEKVKKNESLSLFELFFKKVSSFTEHPIDHSEDSEIELFVNNVVASFALGCTLNLRKIAMEAANVIYRRDQAVSLEMKHNLIID